MNFLQFPSSKKNSFWSNYFNKFGIHFWILLSNSSLEHFFGFWFQEVWADTFCFLFWSQEIYTKIVRTKEHKKKQIKTSYFYKVSIICPSISGNAEAVESILSFLYNNPEPQNKDFETPLDLASKAGHYQIIREVYENLEILSPDTEMYNIHKFENSMEGVE